MFNDDDHHEEGLASCPLGRGEVLRIRKDPALWGLSLGVVAGLIGNVWYAGFLLVIAVAYQARRADLLRRSPAGEDERRALYTIAQRTIGFTMGVMLSLPVVFLIACGSGSQQWALIFAPPVTLVIFGVSEIVIKLYKTRLRKSGRDVDYLKI